MSNPSPLDGDGNGSEMMTHQQTNNCNKDDDISTPRPPLPSEAEKIDFTVANVMGVQLDKPCSPAGPTTATTITTTTTEKDLKTQKNAADENDEFCTAATTVTSTEEVLSPLLTATSTAIVTPIATASATSNTKITENPFNISVILNHFFSICSKKLLESCRLVCKQWYEESSPVWRRSVQILIRCPIGIEEAIKVIDGGLCSMDLHYQNVWLSMLMFKNEEERKQFQTVIGAHLTVLTLANLKFQSVNEFRQIVFNSCPQLQKLSIIYCRLPPKGEEKDAKLKSAADECRPNQKMVCLNMMFGTDGLPIQWSEVFQQFPMLTYFRVGTTLTEDEIMEIIQGIRISRQEKDGNLPFEYFELRDPLIISSDPISQSRCADVKELRLPFTSAAIKLSPRLDYSFLFNMLADLANSVEYIKIFNAEQVRDMPTWIRNFPFGINMIKLETLRCHGDYLPSLAFMGNFPELSSLEILSDNRDPTDLYRYIATTSLIQNSVQEDVEKLSTLERFKLEFRVTLEQCIQLCNVMMINIKELDMALDYQQFQEVCNRCTNLCRLKILGDSLTQTEIVMIRDAVDAKEFGEIGSGTPIEKLLSLEGFTFAAGFYGDEDRSERTYFWLNMDNCR